jgi:hypothetical protein
MGCGRSQEAQTVQPARTQFLNAQSPFAWPSDQVMPAPAELDDIVFDSVVTSPRDRLASRDRQRRGSELPSSSSDSPKNGNAKSPTASGSPGTRKTSTGTLSASVGGAEHHTSYTTSVGGAMTQQSAPPRYYAAPSCTTLEHRPKLLVATPRLTSVPFDSDKSFVSAFPPRLMYEGGERLTANERIGVELRPSSP